jgi:hypothetical protein
MHRRVKARNGAGRTGCASSTGGEMAASHLRIVPMAVAIALLLGCGANEPDEPDHSGGAGGAVGSASSTGAAGVAGSGGTSASASASSGGAPCLRDPCEAYADHATCCGDPACGWHQGTGHQLLGMPPCVAKERVCEAGNREIRDCPSGTTCIVEGAAQETEDDCVLPPSVQVYLPGRGICLCR